MRTENTFPFTYLALGDSYTIGESVSESERWSVQLTNLLGEEGINISAPEIIARTGWTASELIAAIEARSITGNYSIVSLLIGVNNQYRGEHVDKFRTDFRKLLAIAIKFAGGRQDCVFVLTIPDWGVTPFAESRDRVQVSREIDTYNQAVMEECAAAGIELIDVTPLSRKALNDSSMIAADNLHFSKKMYSQWAEFALPVVRKMLQ